MRTDGAIFLNFRLVDKRIHAKPRSGLADVEGTRAVAALAWVPMRSLDVETCV